MKKIETITSTVQTDCPFLIEAYGQFGRWALRDLNPSDILGRCCHEVAGNRVTGFTARNREVRGRFTVPGLSLVDIGDCDHYGHVEFGTEDVHAVLDPTAVVWVDDGSGYWHGELSEEDDFSACVIPDTQVLGQSRNFAAEFLNWDYLTGRRGVAEFLRSWGFVPNAEGYWFAVTL